MTVFILGRWLDLGIAGAYLLQAVSFAICAAVAVWIWRPGPAIDLAVDYRRRALLTGVLALLATPYGYSYDAIPFSVAVGFFFLSEPRFTRWPAAILYLWPLFLHVANEHGIAIGVLGPMVFAGMAVFWIAQDRRPTGAMGEAVKAS